MSQSFADRTLPRPLLIGAGLVVAVAVAATGFSSLTGLGRTTAESTVTDVAVAETVEFTVRDRPDGRLAFRDARDGRVLHVVDLNAEGFLRAVMHGLGQDRLAQGAGPDAPFRLTRWGDGRLWLLDTATGNRVALEAFGRDNAGAFARLFTPSAERTTP